VQHSALVASSYDITAPSVRVQLFWRLHTADKVSTAVEGGVEV